MLRLRVSIDADRVEDAAQLLHGTGGVRRILRLPVEGSTSAVVLSSEVAPSAADELLSALHEFGVSPDDYILVREEVVAPPPVRRQHPGFGGDFAWVEVMGEARAHSRPLSRYLALINVAAVIAGLGVITDNPILIVGAMAVSPDLLPICATCVGLVGRRYPLARRAFLTLVLGLGLVVATAAILAAALDLLDFLPNDFEIGQSGLGGLAHTDYSTVLIALAAGIAAMLSFETRAAAAVGVAISVTTIPASAYLGVAIGVGEGRSASGALGVLAVNVTLLIISGTLTLAAQRWAALRAPANR